MPSNLPISNTDDDEFAMLRAQVENALAGEIAGGNVAVRRTSEELIISLREVGFFDSGSADIQIQRLAEVLLATGSDIRVEGHTDNVPIHNARFSSNWDLSTARATAIVRLFIVKHGLQPDWLAASGHAEFRPIASTTTPRAGRRTGGWIL